MSEIVKYLISGIINTIIGYAIFLISYKLFNIAPALANTMGYAIALINAYILSRNFVFHAKNKTGLSKQVHRFTVSFIISFILNQAILNILIQHIHIKAEYAQIASMCAYTITFYILCKYFVFAKTKQKGVINEKKPKYYI